MFFHPPPLKFSPISFTHFLPLRFVKHFHKPEMNTRHFTYETNAMGQQRSLLNFERWIAECCSSGWNVGKNTHRNTHGSQKAHWKVASLVAAVWLLPGKWWTLQVSAVSLRDLFKCKLTSVWLLPTTLSWFEQSVSVLSPLKPVSDLMQVYVGFVMNKVALRQGFLLLTSF